MVVAVWRSAWQLIEKLNVMIIDSLKNSRLAELLHPDFKLVFDYVRTHELSLAATGRIELKGDDVYINIAQVEGKESADAVLETHEQYIDIQFPLSGVESFGWKAAGDMTSQSRPYDAKDDIAFFEDAPHTFFTLHPGEFAVFFPEDGHAPCIGQGKIKKAIAKVKVVSYDK